MKGNRLIKAAPKYQISFETGKLYKHLSPESKDTVYNAFFSWFSEARKRGAAYNEIPIDDSAFDDMETDCLNSMIENACDGLDNYWSRCKVSPELSETVSGSPRQSQAGSKESIDRIGETHLSSEERAPTIEMVVSFAKENGLRTDLAEKFVDYYTANGWLDGNGNSVTDWQAKYRIWVLNEKKTPKKTVTAQQFTQRTYTDAELEGEMSPLLREAIDRVKREENNE